MDAKELFKQLSCGAIFTKPIASKSYGQSAATSSYIKKEIKDEQPSVDSDVSIKSEDESDNEGQNKQIQILSDSAMPVQVSKKKKKVTAEQLKNWETEKINHLRNKYHIHVKGSNPPDPLETFDEMKTKYSIDSQVFDNLFGCGYNVPTPIQMQAIPIMASGRSLMACAQTGSGKTSAFLLPIIRDLKKPKKRGFRAVILCPTRELAKQTQRECLRLVDGLGLRVHILSKVNQAESRYGDKSNKKFDILITTPNRVCYLLNQKPVVLDLKSVKWLILDEADKLFEEGKNGFREQFDQIYKECSRPSIKVGLFSATWTNAVAKWCRKNLKGYLTITIGQRNAATDLVEQELVFVGSEAGKLLAFREMLRKGLQPPVLVFVDSKDRAQQLYKELMFDGINIDVIHSDRSQQERDNVVKDFREGKVWVLVCTEIIGRGIDFKGVNLVVNYDFPQSAISYIHRIGRTGRAGRRGRAITYWTQNDTINLKSIAKVIKNSGCPVPEYMLTMKEHSKKAKKKLEKTVPEREDISVKHAARKHVKANKFNKNKVNGKPIQNGKVSKVKSKTKFKKTMKTEGKKIVVKKVVNGK
ncbi:hypothetical protein HA402_001082 [Bradysia odoriphaga]|nr:hypothetical protein HA402_001082 [Bradysia odoriphaga]